MNAIHRHLPDLAAQRVSAVLALLALARIAQGGTPPDFDWTYTLGTPRGDVGTLGDWAADFAVDGDGNILVVGGFGLEFDPVHLSADFDPSDEVDLRTTNGWHDAFIVKLSPAGEYIWALTFGAEGDETASDLLVLEDGSFVVTGWFEDTVDFDPGPNVSTASSNGGLDLFVTRFSATGEHVWTRTFGGPGDERWAGLATDPSGNIVLSGAFWNTVDFDPGPAMTQRTSAGLGDAFVLRLNQDGDFVDVTTFGGTGHQNFVRSAVAPDGSTYVAGEFSGTIDFDPGPGAISTVAVGGQDAYLIRLDPLGGLSWAWFAGSPDQDVATDVKLLPSGDVVMVGLFGASPNPIDFDPSDGVDLFQTSEFEESFMTVLAPDRTYRWTRTTATNFYIYANSVFVGPSGIFVTGGGGGVTDFTPNEPGGVQQFRSLDAYVWHVNFDGEFQWAMALGDTVAGGSNGSVIGLDPLGNLLCSGFIIGACDFDPGPALARATSNGGHDAFLAKWRYFFPSADHDGSGHVDLFDFAAFQGCFDEPSPGSPCQGFDSNESTRIDPADYPFFHGAINGP